MDRNIQNLEPKIVWVFFKQLTEVPRPSKHEEKVREMLISIATRLGLDYTVTDIGNLVVRKKATDNSPSRKKIIMQAHMDMVPSKTKESIHNFLTDKIDAYIDGEWVTANQTTLGADNGMGVAMGLAVMASSDIKHNDIELFITVDEEAGMSGAFAITGEELTGDVLINLDSEEDDEVCVGCAGGITTKITYPVNYIKTPADYVSYKVALKGLFSGHSGVDITVGRCNAIKEIACLLTQLSADLDFKLVSISGGKLSNVIPSYAEAVIVIAPDKIKQLESFVSKYQTELIQEFMNTDPDLDLSIAKVEDSQQVMEANSAQSIVFALSSCFNGVWRMNNALGIAETSSNIGAVETRDDSIFILTMQRSSIESAKIKVSNVVSCVFELIGAKVEKTNNYPGWQPNLDSEALAVLKRVYQNLFHEPIKVGATHGGLECGLIMDKYPRLDTISIGATIRFPHSPNEKVNIKSVTKSWNVLVHLVNSL